MPSDNKKIASILNTFADELEKIGENPYRIRAYRRAAKSILNFPKSLTKWVESGNALTDVPQVGAGIASIIDNYLKNNSLPVVRLRPKRIIDLTKDISDRDKYSPSTSSRRLLRLFRVMPFVEILVNKFKTLPSVKAAECVGDFRRKKEIFNSLEIIFVTNSMINTIEEISRFSEIQEVHKISNSQFAVKLYSGLSIMFTHVSAIAFGTQLLASTGSKLHYNQLQQLATQKKLTLTEQGLYKGKKRLIGNEKEIYTHLNLAYIEPELREQRGEIEYAKKNKLPKLIELTDIRGDLHSHTTETDGKATLETMVNAAIERGYEYFAITDHSQRLTITNGLNEKRLMAQIKLIDKLNEKLAGKITILKSIEVDILEDGNLDLPNSILKELDLRVCSIHSKFRLPTKQQTERVLRAMDNPYFNILGHPTGRLIKKRDPYLLDFEKIFKAAKERNCFFELNGQPYRLDLNDEYCKMAKEMGLKISISSDAHSGRELSFMQFGVDQARRGWLEAVDVINTRSLKELRHLLKRK